MAPVLQVSGRGHRGRGGEERGGGLLASAGCVLGTVASGMRYRRVTKISGSPTLTRARTKAGRGRLEVVACTCRRRCSWKQMGGSSMTRHGAAVKIRCLCLDDVRLRVLSFTAKLRVSSWQFGKFHSRFSVSWR